MRFTDYKDTQITERHLHHRNVYDLISQSWATRLRNISEKSLLATEIKSEMRPLSVVNDVDLSKYAGIWYEIAAYPRRIHNDHFGTTVEYTLAENGRVLVKNSYYKGGPYGEQLHTSKMAFVKKNSRNAKLEMQTIWPFKTKYWIVGLAENYSYALISHPGKKYLWVLSRTRKISHDDYLQIIETLKENDFNPKELIITPQ